MSAVAARTPPILEGVDVMRYDEVVDTLFVYVEHGGDKHYEQSFVRIISTPRGFGVRNRLLLRVSWREGEVQFEANPKEIRLGNQLLTVDTDYVPAAYEAHGAVTGFYYRYYSMSA